MAYRIYMSDSLYYQGESKRMTVRYIDAIKPKAEEDTRTADEIALDIINRLKLEE